MLVSVLPWSEARTDAQLVRRFVFIEEQQIPESLELDEAGDSQCWHAIARDGNEPVGTGRLFPDGHVGRMAVVKSHRSKGVGGLILNALIARAREQKIQFVRLGAQVSAEKFYLGHKFVREGDPYVHPQVPIEHVDMVLPLASVYLDFNSTTPLCDRALAAMSASLSNWGNPGSIGPVGEAARKEIDSCKAAVADLLECQVQNLVITSGGTESNNTVLRSVLENKPNPVAVISPFEHPAIDEVFKALPNARVIRVPVDRRGIVDEKEFVAILKSNKVDLVSIMWANNEIGSVNDIPKLVRLTREHCSSALFHSDAAQAVGKVPVVVGDLDFVTVVAHKFYGPKSIGVLFSRVPFAPLLRGGSQQGGRRAGTESALLCSGMGAAALFAKINLEKNAKHMKEMRDFLWEELSRMFPKAEKWNDESVSLPNTLSVCLDPEGPLANDIVSWCSKENVLFSAGAACHSGVVHPSQTLLAIGVDPKKAIRTLRFSVGHSTCKAEILFAVARLAHWLRK